MKFVLSEKQFVKLWNNASDRGKYKVISLEGADVVYATNFEKQGFNRVILYYKGDRIGVFTIAHIVGVY